jgi:hypothetical protein
MISACSRQESSSPRSDELSRSFAEVKVGMNAEDTRKLVGEPQEVRRRSSNSEYIENEAYRWIYGSDSTGGFARVGVVIFDDNGKVLRAYRPSVPLIVRRFENSAPHSPREETSEAGIYCLIDQVYTDDTTKEADLRLVARVSIINRTSEDFVLETDHRYIANNLVIELYDRKKDLIFKTDRGAYSYGYRPDIGPKTKHTIHPGCGLSEEFRVLVREVSFGKLPTGTYYLRVAYPFRPERLSWSNLYEFRVEN